MSLTTNIGPAYVTTFCGKANGGDRRRWDVGVAAQGMTAADVLALIAALAASLATASEAS